ncbi:hypothetical protein HDU99_008281, partial [Rhizoclosmatium hyalinum]
MLLHGRLFVQAVTEMEHMLEFNSLFHCGYVSKNGLTWTLVTTCPQNSICYAGGING